MKLKITTGTWHNRPCIRCRASIYAAKITGIPVRRKTWVVVCDFNTPASEQEIRVGLEKEAKRWEEKILNPQPQKPRISDSFLPGLSGGPASAAPTPEAARLACE